MRLSRRGSGGGSSRGCDRCGRGGGGGLFLMRVGVLDHPVLTDEPLSADITGERLLAGVEAHVPSKVRLVIELLRTDLALVRLVSRVFGQVLLKGDDVMGGIKCLHSFNVLMCSPDTGPRLGISFRTGCI